MILAAAGLIMMAQVSEAQVQVRLDTGGYSITADYVFHATPDSLVFDAIHWPGQTISLEDTVGGTVVNLGGLLRMTPLVRDTRDFHISYTVQGELERLPIFLPNVPTVPGTSAVVIIVHEAESLLLADAFPRFVRRSDGSAIAQPANLPSFVLVPFNRRTSRARVADGIVIVVLVIASGFWLFRKTRAAS